VTDDDDDDDAGNYCICGYRQVNSRMLFLWRESRNISASLSERSLKISSFSYASLSKHLDKTSS
jgi:hypothetical protein